MFIYPATLIYNFLILLVDLFAIRMMRRRRGFMAWFAAVFITGVAAIALGVFLTPIFENAFGLMRLWCYGIFLHGSILFIATAIIWRKKRFVAIGAAAVVLILCATFVYAFLVEPFQLQVNRYEIVTPKITRPVRIIVIADLQTDHVGHYERKALQRAKEEDADLVLFAGDYIQEHWKKHKERCRELNELLKEIDFAPPLGAYAVGGNVDPSCWMDIFEGTNIKAVDRTRSFDIGRLRLTCLSLPDSFGTSRVETEPGDGRFHIIIGHVPDFALGNGEADLLVAGHTHGGQLQLPLIGPVMNNSQLPRRLSCGFNDLPDGGGKLLVSRGVGMERGHAPRFRLFCPPELVVIELVPEHGEKADE